MYEAFYGFSEKPFNTTPDSKFFFPSAKHTEALNSLIYAISERKGFVVITGEIGAGKTTVCRALLNKLDTNTKTALITNTHLTSRELIASVIEEFEIEHQGKTKQKLLSALNRYLINQLAAGMNTVLIIDEAQNLTPTVLEEVRMLSNLETEKEKLIQIILLGQPELKRKLQHVRLEQFKQRIAVYYHINELSKQETQDYMLYRMKQVGKNGVADIFDSQAVDTIYDYSQGIPRLINLVCDSALLSGYVRETKKLTKDIIKEVIKERGIEDKMLEVDLDEKLYCCLKCHKFNNCEIKWQRGLKQEPQLCCDKCHHYVSCSER